MKGSIYRVILLTIDNRHIASPTEATVPVTLGSGANQKGARAWNDRLVLSLLRRNGGLAKAELSRLTGLSAQALGQIIKRLEKDHLVKEGAPVRGKVGQPSKPWSLDADGVFSFGLNIGRRSVELVLVDFLGTPRASARKVCTPVRPDDVISLVQDNLDDLRAILPGELQGRIAGFGISLPGILRQTGHLTGEEEVREWRDVDLVGHMHQVSGLPVSIANDGTAAAAAELLLRPEDHGSNYIYLFIGWHLGGGMVLNGSIYAGQGNAGAIGSLPVQGQGGPVALTDIASIASLDAMLNDKGLEAAEYRQSDIAWTMPEDVLGQWLDASGKAIAQALQAATAMMEYDLAIIDGVLPPDIREVLTAKITANMSCHAMPGITTPTIQPGKIGRSARAIGAAVLPLLAQYSLDRDVLLNAG